MRVAIIAILIASGAPALSSRVDAHDRSRSLRLSDSLQKSPGGLGSASTVRWLLQVQLRSLEGSAQGATSAGRWQDAASLPDLPNYVRSRACRTLCKKKADGSEDSCWDSCYLKAKDFDGAAKPPQASGSETGEYYGDTSCEPVADFNVIGMPSFEEFDIRRDDYLDWREMGLYAHLLCIPEVGMADMFHALDADQNLLISGEEWNAYAVQAESAGVPDSTTTPGTTTAMFDDAFFLALERELDLIAPDFNAMDLNDDGKLEQYEFASGFMSRIVMDHPDMPVESRSRIYQEISHEFFHSVDTNHDYFISKVEYETAHSQGLMMS